jgi:hypothetical protein
MGGWPLGGVLGHVGNVWAGRLPAKAVDGRKVSTLSKLVGNRWREGREEA